jgi:FMN phosphatase YigB (HAD superfamily)
MQSRKDDGTIWRHILSILGKQSSDIIHIGDNLVSDVQIPTELGLGAFYVMHPLQKFAALLGRNSLPSEMDRELCHEYWTAIAESAGADPFFSHPADWSSTWLS